MMHSDLKVSVVALCVLSTGILTAASGAPKLNFPTQSFVSSPAHPPRLEIEKSGQALAPGLLTFTHGGHGLLMTDSGELVYSGRQGFNFRVAQLHGKPVISYFRREVGNSGYAYGSTIILNNAYEEIHNVCPQLGLNAVKGNPKCQGDLHESYVTNKGTLVVTAYNLTTPYDLRSRGGPRDGYVIDGQFYEIDIATQKILFSWKSLDYVPISQSIMPLGKKGTSPASAYDYFHINSVEPLDDGRYLVSSRDTSSVFLIAPDGHIIWQFDGRGGGRGSFSLPNLPNGQPAHFAVQHTARVGKPIGDNMVVHFFNNNNRGQKSNKLSSGMEFSLDTTTNKSKLLRYLHDPNHTYSSYREGDWQTLPNGNVIIGYGFVPIIQEFGPTGDTDIRMTVRFGSYGQADYRSTKNVWHAVPYYPPSVAVQSGRGYASWNGCTNVSSYGIYVGRSKKKLQRVNTVKTTGFETSFNLPASSGYLQVAAFDDQNLLRKSKVIRFGA